MFEVVHSIILSRKQKRISLRATNIIKDKRCCTLKGRTIAGGSVKRELYTNELGLIGLLITSINSKIIRRTS